VNRNVSAYLGKLVLLLIAAVSPLALVQPAHAVEVSQNCDAQAPQIKVLVAGVRAKGLLTVELYKPSEKDFLRKASRLKRIRVPAADGVQIVCFGLEKTGHYAVAAYHDIDGDRSLARKWNMLPAEPYALSNNPKPKLRLPKFEDAAFKAGEGTTTIKLELRK
jgi:uncharacterized protein (DUF2141 family)